MRRKKPTPDKITNANADGVYDPTPDLRTCLRPGAMRAYTDCPSRMGNRLHHRCGRVTDLHNRLIKKAKL